MIKIFAHRGYSSKYPENTMLAFEKAYERNVDGIELDCHLTKDGVVVIIHDEIVDRTTNGKGFVKDYTYDELLKLNIDYNGENLKIPTLEEYLIWACDKKIITNIEIKTDKIWYNLIEEKIVKLVLKYKVTDKVIFSSYNHKSILKTKEILKGLNLNIPLGFLNEDCLLYPDKYLLENEVYYYHTTIDSFDDNIRLRLLKNGIKIVIYTIDDINEIARLNKNGIYIVITNDASNNLGGIL